MWLLSRGTPGRLCRKAILSQPGSKDRPLSFRVPITCSRHLGVPRTKGGGIAWVFSVHASSTFPHASQGAERPGNPERPLEEFAGVSPNGYPLTQGLDMLLVSFVISAPPPPQAQPGLEPAQKSPRSTDFGKHERGPAAVCI